MFLDWGEASDQPDTLMLDVVSEADLEISDPVLLIRINQLYEPGMTAKEVYDCTRGVWVLGSRREQARYALAVYHGEVVEVYVIGAWHPAGTTRYTSREIDLERYGNRWEFTGHVAPDQVRSRYIGQSVAHYFRQGEANPVKYIKC